VNLLLKKKFAQQIWEKKKKLEARPSGHPGMSRIKSGDTIRFHWCSSQRLECVVQQVSVWKHIREALQCKGVHPFLPDGPDSVEDAVAPRFFLGFAFFPVLIYVITF
jgi:ASC-1-like (ASCH) protein